MFKSSTIPQSQLEIRDESVWHFTPLGEFAISSAYHVSMEMNQIDQNQTVPSTSSGR